MSVRNGNDDEWISESIIITKNSNLLLIENLENEFVVFLIIVLKTEKWSLINMVETIKLILKK